MDRVATIDDQISVLTYPPEADDLKELANTGFKTIVNLRSAGENGEVLSPDAEAIESRDLGLNYLHFPLSPTDLTHASAKELARAWKATGPDCHSLCQRAAGKPYGTCILGPAGKLPRCRHGGRARSRSRSTSE